MKRLFKIGWIILVVGLIALGIGYFNGGNKTVSFVGARPVVIKDHVRQLSSNQQFDSLELDASTAEVVIKQGSKYKVTYYGMAGQIPQAKLNGKKMNVTQRSNWRMSFTVNGYQNQDLIVVTVPRGHALSGKIKVASGDLRVSNVTLKNAVVSVDEGDVTYNHVKLTSGKTSLSEGDFTGQQLTVKGHYTVHNDEGDNTISNTTVDGYHLYTDDGDNSLNGEDKRDQTLNQNENGVNVLNLVTSEGDNEVN